MEDISKGMAEQMKRKNYQSRFDEMIEVVLSDIDVQSFIDEHKNQLTQADIEKSYAKLYEFTQEKKKFLANDPSMIAPGYEPKLILNYHFIDVTYVKTEELMAKEHQNEVKNRMKMINMPKNIQNASLADYERTSGRSDAWIEAFNFVDSYLENQKSFHKGLYLIGSFGVGKTYLLGAIARELAEGGVVSTLVHFPTFAVEMKQAIATDSVAEKLNKVKHTPVLMIDDIGADSMSSWIRDDVFGVILQHRMQEQLPTFFSSNFSFSDLETHLTISQRGDNEPLKAKRIMERIKFLSKEIMVSGRNRRE